MTHGNARWLRLREREREKRLFYFIFDVRGSKAEICVVESGRMFLERLKRSLLPRRAAMFPCPRQRSHVSFGVADPSQLFLPLCTFKHIFPYFVFPNNIRGRVEEYRVYVFCHWKRMKWTRFVRASWYHVRVQQQKGRLDAGELMLSWAVPVFIKAATFHAHSPIHTLVLGHLLRPFLFFPSSLPYSPGQRPSIVFRPFFPLWLLPCLQPNKMRWTIPPRRT